MVEKSLKWLIVALLAFLLLTNPGSILSLAKWITVTLLCLVVGVVAAIAGIIVGVILTMKD